VVTGAHGSGVGRAIDFSHLSKAERTVLRLLAQGHTVKSIASALGSTQTAINERLRQARRKTGVGSSREAARLLVAHENRHEKIEMEVSAGRQSYEPSAGRRRTRLYWIGLFAMIICLVTVLGVSAYFADTPSARGAPANGAIADSNIPRISRIYDGATLIGGPKWWERHGLSVGTSVCDKKGEQIGTVVRLEPGNDLVRDVLVRSPDGAQVYAIPAGALSRSGNIWTAKSVKSRSSH
jgi:DNA-binding CsgD family transcriptional regulator